MLKERKWEVLPFSFMKLQVFSGIHKLQRTRGPGQAQTGRKECGSWGWKLDTQTTGPGTARTARAWVGWGLQGPWRAWQSISSGHSKFKWWSRECCHFQLLLVEFPLDIIIVPGEPAKRHVCFSCNWWQHDGLIPWRFLVLCNKLLFQ